jgi:NTP pyrophosphatase (non-canonical NTP hydrolase)
MKIKDYQDGARSTAIYPTEAKIAYPVLGLVGEIGELEARFQISEWDEVAIKGEIGDVLWYCANLCSDLQMMLTDCLDLDMHADFSKINPENLYVDDVIVEIGLIAEAAKKIIRDGALEKKKEIIRNRIGRILVHLQSLARDCKSTLEEIAAANLDKLQGRKDRGTLQGDGEER